MDFGQYTGPKQAESRPVRPRFGHLWDFSDSFSTLDFSHLDGWQTAALKGSMGAP